MDIPDLVRERLGDEEITAGVSLGDEDAVCLTPTRTLVYSGEGILSDEGVEEFSHDVERLSLKEGRRKTKFALEFVEGTETFTVPSDRGEKVLELLLEGILRYDDVIDRRESIAGVYRFTELTLVVTEGRVLKHIGSHVWDDDFENYPFESVTGLDFERAPTATSIAIEVDGHPQRVKVPNDTARIVRQTLEKALFAYYDVDSLEEFKATVGEVEEPDVDHRGDESGDDIGFDAGFDPLVTESGDPDGNTGRTERTASDPDPGDREGDGAVPDRMDVSPGSESNERDHRSDDATGSTESETGASGAGTAEEWSAPPGETSSGGERSESGTEKRHARRSDPSDTEPADAVDYEPTSREDLEAVGSQVEDLTEAVERQNELLKRQHRAIKQLVSELRSE